MHDQRAFHQKFILVSSQLIKGLTTLGSSRNIARPQTPPVSFPPRITDFGLLVLPFISAWVLSWVHVGYDSGLMGYGSRLGL